VASSDYRKAYESAKRELTDLFAKQQEIEKRIALVRQSLQALAALSESEGVQIEPSSDAVYLLEHSTLAEEIRVILKLAYPAYMRPHVVKANLEQLGHDLSQYQNPQATIHMVLKRMAESGEAQENTLPEHGKKVYRCVPQVPSLCGAENQQVLSAILTAGVGRTDEAIGPQVTAKGPSWINRGKTRTLVGPSLRPEPLKKK